ncbi:Transcriptional coactivator/pterin dehydratase [Kalmanozyma brasiliensis GHG001]|uniref:4a-hydroxytetrahydrobiopterin dehydratase n=1 Tax=Kalmanozyma brasiliensis (strain GHG001) TaxID=1365824 RepID=V5EX07_KALBG|nr:Transcriptional coactivator/pterin dehydratase [Kalmanozyma brasiliensis GHG001]EST07943.1 Transcriptional coactivator/pterin dehydratase [Kalmanozyma brasiliensis GHG001]
MSSQPLTAQKCEPCTKDLPAMSQDEARKLLSDLAGKWSLSPQPKTLLSSKATHPDALHRTYKFKDFTSAQAFANDLGALAEREGHHPAIMVEWGRVTVWWWSHAINGLHKNDFVMAAKTEELVHQAEGYTPPKPKA